MLYQLIISYLLTQVFVLVVTWAKLKVITIRDLIKNEQVKLYHIGGKKNPANILTKNISQVLFSHFCLFLSLEIL